jgi:cobalt-zinc-cadmium efflux system membrane fusion protein
MKTIFFSVIIGGVALLSASCGQSSTQKQAASLQTEHEHEHGGETASIVLTEQQMNAVSIVLGDVEQRNLQSVVRANGRMDLYPQKQANVTSLVGGIIRQILVKEGKEVTYGQVVAFLENTEIVELQKNYLITQKETQVAAQDFARQQELFAQGAGVEKTLQQASANFEISNARLVGLEKQLQQLSISPEQVSTGNIVTQIPIKAPIAGAVLRININIGSYVDIQTSLMSIGDNSQMHCDLKVFEKDIHLIDIGQEVDLVLTNQQGANLKGEVYEISNSFEGEDKAILVHINIKNKPTRKLLQGMYVAGLINVGTQKASAVPNEAIVSHEGKKYIFVLEDTETSAEGKTYHFVRTEVISGISELGYTQITPVGSLPANATIVKSNAFYVGSMSTEHGEHGH